MWSQLTQIAAAAAEKAQSVATDLLDEATADLVSARATYCLRTLDAARLLPPLNHHLVLLQSEARQQVGSLLQAPSVRSALRPGRAACRMGQGRAAK